MAEYVNVAVDAMGGDNAPTEIVKGAVEAVNADKRVKVFLVGKEPVIREELKAYTYDAEQLEVVHAEEVIETAEPPVMAIRRKKDSSIVKAMYMVKNGECDAFVSAGSTGAVLVGGQVMAKEGKYATLRLPSGEMRMVPLVCRASIGVVGNGDHNLINVGKAGRKRHMGIRPTVRGSVMNPNDHPHGGGEGKSPVGRPGPCTPWGKPALGYKTRNKKKASNKMIVRRRNGK